MKYFTRKFISGALGQRASQAASVAYFAYLSKLSPALQNLGHLNLHDAYILALKNDATNHILTIQFRRGDLQVGYADATLQFSEVTIGKVSLNLLQHAVRPSNVVALASEVDRAKGKLTFRMLLWPKGEIRWTFEGVTIKSKAVLTRASKKHTR